MPHQENQKGRYSSPPPELPPGVPALVIYHIPYDHQGRDGWMDDQPHWSSSACISYNIYIYRVYKTITHRQLDGIPCLLSKSFRDQALYRLLNITTKI